MLRPSTSAATARQRADEETEAEPVRVRNPGPRVRTRRELGPPPRGSDGDGSGCRCARPGRTPNRAPEEAAAAAEGDDHDAIARGTQGIGGLALPPTHYQQERFGGGLGGREWKSGVALGDGSLAPRPPPAFRFVMGSGSRQRVKCAVGKAKTKQKYPPVPKPKLMMMEIRVLVSTPLSYRFIIIRQFVSKNYYSVVVCKLAHARTVTAPALILSSDPHSRFANCRCCFLFNHPSKSGYVVFVPFHCFCFASPPVFSRMVILR